MKNTQIRANLQRLESDRKVVEDIWTDIERYVCPYRGKFYEPQTAEGEFEWFRPQRMDDTAVKAHNRLASTLQSKLTPSAYQWFKYKFDDTRLAAKKQFTTWLEDCTDRAWKELGNSLFGESMGSFYSDFTSFHSAYLGMEIPNYRDWDGMDFKCLPLKECFAERDHKGRIIRFYRKMNLTVLQMVEKFGEENIPELYRDRFKASEQSGGDVTSKYPVIFAAYKRKNIKVPRGKMSVSQQARPYGYKYVDYNTAEEFGEEGGYYSMPIYFVRYRQAVGSDFGYGPAMESMSDIKTLNRLLYLYLKMLEKIVDPAILTEEDNLITQLDLSGMTVVEDIDKTKVFDATGHPEALASSSIMMYRDGIRQAFHEDQFQLKESPAMTATEVGARTRQQHETIGSPVENMKSQGLKPMLEDLFWLMLRFDRFLPAPDGIDIDKLKLDIEYFGSIALAQKADIATGIERTIGDVAGMAEPFPEILDVFNPDEIAKELGALNGAPSKIYRSEGEVMMIRQQRAEQQQAQAQAEQAKTEAEAMDKGASAIEKMNQGQGAGLAEVLRGGI